MPYKRVKPVDESDMRKQRYLGHHSVCEKIREIWRATEDPDIKFKCREAMAMTKKMHEKLKKYGQFYKERVEE
jgi:hypothetical protein